VLTGEIVKETLLRSYNGIFRPMSHTHRETERDTERERERERERGRYRKSMETYSQYLTAEEFASTQLISVRPCARHSYKVSGS
jgi:hypothetical protein